MHTGSLKEAQQEEAGRQPFGLQWLDSAYQQTLLPYAPWHQMEERISQVLTQRVEKQFLKADRKEALLQLLGPDFTDKYLPSARHNPWCLEPPAMREEEKIKVVREAQAYLNSQMYKAVRDVGYQHMTAVNTGENPPPDYSAFLQHSFNIFMVGLDRELCRQEQELTKEKKHQLHLERTYKMPVPSRIKPVSTGSSSMSSQSTTKPGTSAIRAMVQKPEGDPPPLWGPQSDAVGKSILAVLQRDPRKFDHVAGRLHGRQLPGSLRAYMWSDVLFKVERKRMKEVVVEKVVRERFAKAISRGLQELRIKRATSSPINGLIENAVIETYNKTTSLIPYKTPDHMKEAIRGLNILYVYDRSYEPYLIYWLFPLQIAFQAVQPDRVDDRGEVALELGMYLDLLNSNCFPKWPAVFALAEKALTTIKQSDPDFYNHLKTICKIDVKVNPKEFLVQLLHQEKTKADALMQSTPGGAREQQMSSQLLADPLVFVRRWIGEGFVSILDTPSVMYVWDQCFMQSWQDTVIENFCIAILELLRHKFMEARNYHAMKEVFLKEACKLYTMDLQHAWIHLERGNDAADIPFLNRQQPASAASRMSQASFESNLSPVPSGLMNPCGIKDIKLHMVIPSEVMAREPWLTHVDANNLKLHVTVYFGDVRLQSRISMMPSNVSSTSQDSYGNTIYQVVYPEDRFVFRDVDLGPYDLAREMGAYPYALIRVEYQFSGTSDRGRVPVPVGWARIPLFQRQSVYGATSVTSMEIQWDLQAGDHTYDLHPGDIPDTLISTQPITPSESGHDEGTILGYNSQLMCVVYDPKNEPTSKFPASILQQVAPRDTRGPSPAVHVPSRQRSTPLPTPTPTPRSTPQSTPSSRQTGKEWVPYRKEAARGNPSPTGLKDPIDLYIDSIRYIPDNASVIKVTGRVLRTGEVGNVEDILAMPDLNSSGRSPTFDYRLTINKDKSPADPGMLVFLRVYTVDFVGETIGVVGSCLVPLFDSNKKLRVGGDQVRLHNGMPQLSQPGGIAGIKPSDLDTIPTVPACSLLVRILPHTQSPAAYPGYNSGYFQSESCRPSTSEYRIFRSYAEHMAYPKNVREMIQRMMENEGLPSHGMTDQQLLDWLQNRLDVKKHLPPGKPAENLSLTRCVRYKLKMGLNVKINQVYGLSEGLYIQCFARLAPGGKVLGMDPTDEGFGAEEKFVTLKHDFTSYQQAQKWEDDPQKINPFYDPYSVLIVQLFGLEVLYHPTSDHNEPGHVTDLNGQELSLTDEDRIIGWAVVPLFEGNSVLGGIHHVPIFKGKPTAEMLQQFTTESADVVLKDIRWSAKTKYTSGSMCVTLWDAHFDYGDVPELPVYEYMLESVGKLNDYRKVRDQKQGKTINHFVIDSLETKYKKQGTNSSVFHKEQGWFRELMETTFYDLMESALMTAGYGPL